MIRLQEYIHKYEVGAGVGTVRAFLGVIVMISAVAFYDLFAFQSRMTVEGMDAAQVARNLAEGRGYTTDWVRPFSLFLLRRHEGELQNSKFKIQNSKTQTSNAPPSSADAGTRRPSGGTNTLPAFAKPSLARFRDNHPDLANAPVYPLLVSGWLRVMPKAMREHTAVVNQPIYLPDFWIALLNQLLFMAVTCLLFRLARKLFDDLAAWLSAVAFFGTGLMWKFASSGLPTLLLMVFFVLLAGVLARLDRMIRHQKEDESSGRLYLMAGLAGLLVAVACLTRYAFGWLMVPVVFWLVLGPGGHRLRQAGAAVLAFGIAVTPWVWRNYQLSGTPFGTAGYALHEATVIFPADQLPRSLEPNLALMRVSAYWQKLSENLHQVLQVDLPTLSGSWVPALFVVGLMVPFKNRTVGRLRLWLVLCLLTLTVVQALGRTSLSADAPELSGENLLVVLAPLVMAYGASLFCNLLAPFAAPPVRFAAVGTFCMVACLPLALSLGPDKPMLYQASNVREKTARLGDPALVMTDIPWAVAWYGQRQSVGWTLRHQDADGASREDFYAVHRDFKPVSALYFAGAALRQMEPAAVARWAEATSADQDWEEMEQLATRLGEWLRTAPQAEEHLGRLRRMLDLMKLHWIRGGVDEWTSFVLGAFVNREVPTGFPLRRAPWGLLPEIFLTDSEQPRGSGIQSSK